MECRGQQAPSIRQLFNDTRATPAVLEFFRKTKVGYMTSQLLLEAGQDDEEEVEEIELWPQEEETEISNESEQQDGPGPPS